jgi:hypothetical protein
VTGFKDCCKHNVIKGQFGNYLYILLLFLYSHNSYKSYHGYYGFDEISKIYKIVKTSFVLQRISIKNEFQLAQFVDYSPPFQVVNSN